MAKRNGRHKHKLLAVDLDGTLLDGQGRPHAEDVRALRAARAHGVHVTIVTGRLYSGTRRSAEDIGMTGPVGCVDGSQLVSTETHKTLFHHAFRGAHATLLRDSISRAGPATFLFARDSVVYDPDGAAYIDYVSTWSTAIVQAPKVSEHSLWTEPDGVTAVVAVGTMQQVIDAADNVRTALGAEAQVATFPTRRLEATWGMVVRASGGNKGSALRWIAEHYGVPMENTVVVGDWVNDIPMFDVAGRSFCMGQGPDPVKERATDVLDQTSIEGGGIAHAIQSAFGITA